MNKVGLELGADGLEISVGGINGNKIGTLIVTSDGLGFRAPGQRTAGNYKSLPWTQLGPMIEAVGAEGIVDDEDDAKPFTARDHEHMNTGG